jgi:outer membrane protein assembly factor BamB
MRSILASGQTSIYGVRGIITDSNRIKGRFEVVDLNSGSFLRDFEVRWEPGSRQTICRDGVLCVAGAYDEWGVAAYDLRDGSEVWRRKDLKRIQVVTAFENEDLVFCGREGKPAHLLNSQTGQTVREFRGVYTLWPNPYDNSRIVGATRFELHYPLGVRRAVIARNNNDDEMCAAFSRGAVIIAERRGAVRCFSTQSGDCRWIHTLPDERHVEHATFLERENVFVVFECRHYDHKPPARLLHLDTETGVVCKEIVLGSWRGAEFCLKGTALFDASGLLTSTINGELIRTLQFPKHDKT